MNPRGTMENSKVFVVVLTSGTLLFVLSFLAYFYLSRDSQKDVEGVEGASFKNEHASNTPELLQKLDSVNTDVENHQSSPPASNDQASPCKLPNLIPEKVASDNREKVANDNRGKAADAPSPNNASVNQVPMVSATLENNHRTKFDTGTLVQSNVITNGQEEKENVERLANNASVKSVPIVNADSTETTNNLNTDIAVKSSALSEAETKKSEQYVKMLETNFNERLKDELDKNLTEKYEKLLKGEANPPIDEGLGYICNIMVTYTVDLMQNMIKKVLAVEPLDSSELEILGGAPFQLVKKVEELNGRNPYCTTSQPHTFELLLAKAVNAQITVGLSYEALEGAEKVLQDVYAEYKKRADLIKKLEARFRGVGALVAKEYSNKMYAPLARPIIKEMIRRAVARDDLNDVIKRAQDWMAKYSINPTLPCLGITLQLNAPIEEVVKRFEQIYLPFPYERTAWNSSDMRSQNPPRSVINTAGICYAISLYQCLATFYPLIKKFAIGEHPKTKHLLNILDELNKSGAPPLDLQPYVNLPGSGNSYMVFRGLAWTFRNDLAAIKDFNWHHLAGVTVYDDMTTLNFSLSLGGSFLLEKDTPTIVLNCIIIKGPLLTVGAEGYMGTIPRELEIKDMTGVVRRYDLRAMAMGDNGHFASFVYRGDTWYHCNDASVTPIAEPPLEPAQYKSYGRAPSLCFYLLNLA